MEAAPPPATFALDQKASSELHLRTKRSTTPSGSKWLRVAPAEESLLNGFHFEFSEGGNWMRFRFTCCNAAGAPTVLASTYPGPGPALEGLPEPQMDRDARGQKGGAQRGQKRFKG